MRKSIMRKLGVLMILGVALFGQIPPDNYIYEFTGSTVLTLQQPATNARQVQPLSAWFYCAAAQTVTLKWNMTGATTTAQTPLLLPPTVNPAVAKIFTASNASNGTTGPVYNVPAGVTFPISLTAFKFGTTGINSNLDFVPNGTCTMDVTWQEF